MIHYGRANLVLLSRIGSFFFFERNDKKENNNHSTFSNQPFFFTSQYNAIMRRFPPPPNSGGPSTPSTRSKESPMQFEFTTPRTFPLSSFSIATNTATPEDGMNGIDEHGERARKRNLLSIS